MSFKTRQFNLYTWIVVEVLVDFKRFSNLLKIFVANPNKTQAIRDILIKNKEKLVEFLENFHTDRTGTLFESS